MFETQTQTHMSKSATVYTIRLCHFLVQGTDSTKVHLEVGCNKFLNEFYGHNVCFFFFLAVASRPFSGHGMLPVSDHLYENNQNSGYGYMQEYALPPQQQIPRSPHMLQSRGGQQNAGNSNGKCRNPDCNSFALVGTNMLCSKCYQLNRVERD